MTCIVGVRGEGQTWLGADSQVTESGTLYTTLSEPKVFPVGRGAIAVAGFAAWTTVLFNAWRWPTRPRDLSADGYMVLRVRPALKKLWSTHFDEPYDSGLLLAHSQDLWQVDESFTPFRVYEGYAADGSGRAVALGALYETSRSATPRDAAMSALKASSVHAVGVREPFNFVCVED